MENGAESRSIFLQILEIRTIISILIEFCGMKLH